MAKVVRLDDYRRPARSGNGAREALAETIMLIPTLTFCFGVLSLADWMLLALSMRGFIIVPLPPEDAA